MKKKFILGKLAVGVLLVAVLTSSSSLGYTKVCPNPADCGSFFSCSNGVKILMHCPDGLHFNSRLEVCDWPSNVGCMGGEGRNCSCEYDYTPLYLLLDCHEVKSDPKASTAFYDCEGGYNDGPFPGCPSGGKEGVSVRTRGKCVAAC